MNLLEKIRERIARLAELSADELNSLAEDVNKAFDEFDAQPTTPETVNVLTELGQAGTQIITRRDEIAQEELSREEAKNAARAVRDQLNATNATDEGGEGEGGTEDEAEAEDKELASVTAAGKNKFRSTPSAMRRTAPVSVSTGTTGSTALVAAGNGVRGKVAGQAFDSRNDLARTIVSTLKGLDRSSSSGRVIVASANYMDAYPEDRRLTDDAARNAEKMDAVTGQQALVASGGICQPVNVDYSLPTWATPERPLKAGLAQFATDRGGLTYRQPPTLAALTGATGVWTEATDANPAGATKPVLSIACATPETVYVNAIPTRLGFGNLQGQFDPDTIAANTDLAVAAAARTAEIELLSLIQAQTTVDITSAKVLGASRDWLTTIDRITANFRYTHRIARSTFLTAVIPDYVKDMMRADRAMELAHDSQAYDPMAVPDAWVDDMLDARGVRAIWTLDALPVNGVVYPTQQFTGFTASSAVPDFPTAIVWNLFIEGSVQFLDGGLLNLGVVRDATLDATNDYETFIETFEGLAFRGFAGGALQVVSTLHIDGASSATVTVA